jgi:ATP-binding protein involved in chromosome partitioning
MTDRNPGSPDEAMAQAVQRVLGGLRDPISGANLLAGGMVEGVKAVGGLVQVSLRIDPAQAKAMEGLRREAEAAIGRLPGVRNASVVLTAHRPAAAAAAPVPHAHAHGPAAQGPAHGRTPASRPAPLPGVGAVVAIASGKGGVGKSTVAVNLAVALGRKGLRIGLLDADIYGPSLPRMLGESRRPEVQADRIIPIAAWGLKAMSMGFLVEEDSAMIWRGPMIMGAVQQFLGQVSWGELDVLIVDLPPGTGDIQLTLSQKVQVTGAVIVSTPQDIALIDARRAVRMFEKVEVPVLGMIENMSVFCCPNCGHRSSIFGHGGARTEAEKLGLPFLGEIPLLMDVRETADAGTPIVAEQPESEGALAFAAIAESLAARLLLPVA